MANKVSIQQRTATQAFTTSAMLDMGICVTCNSAPDCVNLQATRQPVWHCDQFDDYQPPAAVAGERRAIVKPPQVELSTNGSLQGLCKTCGNKDGCVNQTPGISKLFCEEHC